MFFRGIVKPLRPRRQRVPAWVGLREPVAQLIERRSSCGVHVSAPRAVAHLVRPYHKFLGASWTKAAANVQLKGVTRRIFFDPSLSFDPTTLEPCSSVGAEASASPHKNGQHNCPIFRP